jgi:hypothetical protein
VSHRARSPSHQMGCRGSKRLAECSGGEGAVDSRRMGSKSGRYPVSYWCPRREDTRRPPGEGPCTDRQTDRRGNCAQPAFPGSPTYFVTVLTVRCALLASRYPGQMSLCVSEYIFRSSNTLSPDTHRALRSKVTGRPVDLCAMGAPGAPRGTAGAWDASQHRWGSSGGAAKHSYRTLGPLRRSSAPCPRLSRGRLAARRLSKQAGGQKQQPAMPDPCLRASVGLAFVMEAAPRPPHTNLAEDQLTPAAEFVPECFSKDPGLLQPSAKTKAQPDLFQQLEHVLKSSLYAGRGLPSPSASGCYR